MSLPCRHRTWAKAQRALGDAGTSPGVVSRSDGTDALIGQLFTSDPPVQLDVDISADYRLQLRAQ